MWRYHALPRFREDASVNARKKCACLPRSMAHPGHPVTRTPNNEIDKINFVHDHIFCSPLGGGIDQPAAEAKQTSLIAGYETYKKIDGRTSMHETDANAIREKLGEISQSIEDLHKRLVEVDDPNENVAAKQRRMIRGELTELSAQYLNTAFKLVDKAAHLISANFSDLAALADEVRKSGDPRGSVEQLKTR